MVHPQVADGEDGLQTWRVPVNISSCWHPVRSGPPALGLGRGLTTPHHKN